ncbi:MAG TPA: hypothetical protein VK750_01000, partial [Cytophagaceae bacterium]|nr:hypothetical protein [Cytophagaceae bacterium]
MNKFTSCLLFLFWSFNAYCHHIVGGDVTVSVVEATTHQYKITLTFLFDQVNGSPDAEDPLEVVTIFDKATNALMKSFILQKISNNTYLPYTSSACNTAELKTRIIIYEATVTFPPEVYNEPAGYYLAWERCCRTEELLNILHPDSSGVVFYAEFPAVVKNGNSFIDSTPSFVNLKGDYACTNEYYILDFSAADADGDSLSYALVAPIKGFTTAANPAPYTSDPGPYPVVDFSPGISASDMIPGPVGINIDPRTGSVRGIASKAGLYVFAVACS